MQENRWARERAKESFFLFFFEFRQASNLVLFYVHTSPAQLTSAFILLRYGIEDVVGGNGETGLEEMSPIRTCLDVRSRSRSESDSESDSESAVNLSEKC